jgi:hypothetical protein
MVRHGQGGEDEKVNSQFFNMCIQTWIGIWHFIGFQLATSSASKQKIWYCNPFPILVCFGIGTQFISSCSISTSKRSHRWFVSSLLQNG